MPTVDPSYPLTMPASPVPADSDIHIVAAVALSASIFNYSSQSQDWGGRVWRASMSFPVMDGERADAWDAFIDELAGVSGYFWMPHWDKRVARGSKLGTPLVKGGSQTGNVITTDGWTPLENGLLLRGTVIQIGDRIHEVLANVNSDSGGEADIRIDPPLDGLVRLSPADNAPLVLGAPKGLWRLASNRIPRPRDARGNLRLAFDAVEYLS